MTPRRTSQVLVLLAGLFGVLAFVCACCSSVAGGSDPGRPGSMRRATMNPGPMDRATADEQTEFPKLTDYELEAFNILNQ